MISDLQLVLRLEAPRLCAIAETALRRVIGRLEAAGGRAPLLWHPMTERPRPPAACAMIRCTDAEGAHLMPGPVMWSRHDECWVDEDNHRPVRMTQAGAVYEWCYEHEITGGAP